MSTTVTLADLRTRVRFLGDFENSRVISDARLDEVINGAIEETWELLLRYRPDQYIQTQSPAPTTTANVATVALAADFYRLRQVEILDGGNRRMRPVNPSEAWRFSTPSAQPRGFRYWINGTDLVLVPTPTQVWTLKVLYFKPATELVSDTDSVTTYGYEKLVIAKAICDLLRREKMPMGEWEQERARLEYNVKDNAGDLDAGEPFYLSGTGPEGPEEDLWWVP